MNFRQSEPGRNNAITNLDRSGRQIKVLPAGAVFVQKLSICDSVSYIMLVTETVIDYTGDLIWMIKKSRNPKNYRNLKN